MPPMMNGADLLNSILRRTEPSESSWPTMAPNTTIGPMSCGSIDHAQMLIATRPKAKPDRPCTNPARHVPSTTAIKTSLFMPRRWEQSIGCPAAVDHQALAGHVGRCVGGEEHRCAHHVARRRQTTHR